MGSNSLTAEEKQNIKRHLGYPVVDQGAGLAAGIPISIQTMYLVTDAMERVPDSATSIVREYLGILDANLRLQATLGVKALIADQLEDLKLRSEYLPDMRREYRAWQSRLAQMIHCPINPTVVDSVDTGLKNVSVG